MDDTRFIVFGRPSCPFCTDALELLQELDVEHVFIDLSEDPEGLREAKEFYDWSTVPIILENKTLTGDVSFIGGFTDLQTRLLSG